MAYVWSFGIKFNFEVDALSAYSKINILILSDNTEIIFSKGIEKPYYNINSKEYTLFVMVPNMVYAVGDKKWFSYTFYYEIRDFFYQFLIDLDINFSMALFEFEGADKITNDKIIDEINHYGIGEVLNSDNCVDLRLSDSIYQNKRMLDGLVISNEELMKIKEKYSKYFVEFKKGYYWLPIEKNYKTN